MSIIGQNTGTLSRSGHRLGVDTGVVNPLHIEEYGGEVESSIIATSFMRQHMNIKTIRGTDTVTNNRIGVTSLQKVVPGTRPTSSAPQFDNVSVKVDTVILARSNQALLDDFQASFDVRSEIGKEHGKQIGKFFDEAMLIQGIKSAGLSTVADGGTWKAPEGFQSGYSQALALAGDELDPDKLVQAILDACQAMEEKDVEIMDAVILVAPAQFYTLLNNDKLISRDFSSNGGDFAQGSVMAVNGVRIQVTNRIPKAAITGHYLSNAGNGAAYDVDATEAKTVVLILMPKAVLAGEAIPLTTKVYYSDVELNSVALAA